MSKSVWRLTPYPYFEVDAIEEWLDELSRQGLQFRTKFGPFCHFEHSPAPARYRLDIRRRGDERTDDERINAYRELGWEFCSDYTRDAEVYRAKTRNAVELHTDAELRKDLVKRSFRKQFWGVLLCAFLIADTVWDTAAFMRDAGGTLRPPYLLACSASLALILLLLCDIAVTLTGYFRLRRHDFCPFSHTRKRARRGTLRCLFQILLAVLFVTAMVLALFAAA